MTYVLIYELLIGHGLKGKTSLEKLILMNKASLHASLERIKISHRVKHIEELLPEEIQNPGRNILLKSLVSNIKNKC
jgi:hypothetical protein